MRMPPTSGQILNQCKRHQLVAKLMINAAKFTVIHCVISEISIQFLLGCRSITTMSALNPYIVMFRFYVTLKAQLGCCLVITLWTLKLYMFMNFKVSLGHCPVLTMNTPLICIFMCDLNVLFYISFGRHHIIALFQVISSFIVLCLYVHFEVLLGCGLVLTRIAVNPDILMLYLYMTKKAWLDCCLIINYN